MFSLECDQVFSLGLALLLPLVAEEEEEEEEEEEGSSTIIISGHTTRSLYFTANSWMITFMCESQSLE